MVTTVLSQVESVECVCAEEAARAEATRQSERAEDTLREAQQLLEGTARHKLAAMQALVQVRHDTRLCMQVLLSKW